MQAENEQLKHNLTATRENTGTEIARRLDAEEASLQTANSLAVEAEDNEALFKIRSRQGEIAAEKVALRTIQEEEAREPAPVEADLVRTAPAQLPTLGAEPEAGAEDWQDINPWFGDKSTVQNRIKSAGALMIHQDLLKEGFNPQDDPTGGNKVSDYYIELDKRLGEQFAKAEPETRKPAQTVVGGTRTSTDAVVKSGKVRLTQSEYEFTKRTGIDPVEYAREKARIAARTATS